MNAPVTTPAASSLETKVAGLRSLQAKGDHVAVVTAAQGLLRDWPENRDLLLIHAISLRHLGRIAEALTVLDSLELLQPHFSLGHQERGLCHVARKDAPATIQALLKAVNINPALPMSWRMLEGVYRLNGNADNAATAAAHVAVLKNLPPEVVAATALLSDGDLAPADHVIRPFLLRHPKHPEAMRVLAKIGMARDALDDAELLLDAMLALDPDHRAARHEYAQVLVRRYKYPEARAELNRLLAAEPDNRDYRMLAAQIAVGLGEQQAAIAIYRGLLTELPDFPDLHLWLAHALKTVGQLDEAVQHYQMAAQLRPDFGDAYWSLANLKTYRFSDAQIFAMRDAQAAPATAMDDRIHLCFALGKAFEDRDEIAQSWRSYEQGNALKRAESQYRPEVMEANTAGQKQTCTPAFFDSRKGWGDDSPDPIFIVGLPRSGSTLLEQILASHSAVEGTQELPDIQRLVLEMQGRDPDPENPRYPGILAQMTAEDFRRLGQTYMSATRVYRSGRPFFIDKMPNNFRHIGLIHLMLPKARIIDARREPMACCFSNLKQLFANGQEFTYSIPDIARYYRTYLELMHHWNAVLPGRVLRVMHEDVVDDLEGSVRRILDYCALPFEPGCVTFHQNRRSVRTPSSEQVRQPISRAGLDQWRKFESFLSPLRAALGDALTGYRATADDEMPSKNPVGS